MDPFTDEEARGVLLARIDTARLRRGDENTVALVVLNPGRAPASGRVRFAAAYPVRPGTPSAAGGVVVRDEAGAVVPSRLVSDALREEPGLPPGKRMRSLLLEFAVHGVPARGGRAYAAVYGASPAPAPEGALLDLAVYETDCHEGELPPTFAI